MSNKTEIEEAALQAFLAYLAEDRTEDWYWDEGPRPDEVERNRPSCDYLLTERNSDRRAALEITQFTWPTDRNTTTNRLDSLLNDIEVQLQGSVTGTYTIGASINHITVAKALSPANRKAARSELEDWFRTEGQDMAMGATRFANGVLGLRVTRQSLEGELSIRVSTSVTNIDYPDWIDALDPVLADNAYKFKHTEDVVRWLLIIDPGMVGRLEITGPVLEVPSEVDELFFIDHWPPSSESVFSYNTDKEREGGTSFDRRTGTLRVKVPFRTN